MKIRPLTADDIDKVMIIENAAFPEEDRQKREKILSSLQNPGMIGILALDDTDNPIGCSMGIPLEDYPDAKDANDPNMGKKNTVYLESIAVVPEYQNRGPGSKYHGIGKTLFKNFLIDAMRKGYKRETDFTYGEDLGFRKSVGSKQMGEPLKGWYEGGESAIYCEKTFNLPQKRFSVEYFTQGNGKSA